MDYSGKRIIKNHYKCVAEMVWAVSERPKNVNLSENFEYFCAIIYFRAILAILRYLAGKTNSTWSLKI
jgi:hypothetical protein